MEINRTGYKSVVNEIVSPALDNGKVEEDEEHPATRNVSYNPAASASFLQDEDLEKIKGDAIGNTLYSERFVLSTLLKLSSIKPDSRDDEQFEKDICSLWDMTIEEDVVKLLLKHDSLELFANTISIPETDRRKTEILVGIIANMCSLAETRKEIRKSKDILTALFNLLECTDTLTLIQLMRFFQAAIVIDHSGDDEDEPEWYTRFFEHSNIVESFAFILMNSMNKTLLVAALEALCTILSKFSTMDFSENLPDAENEETNVAHNRNIFLNNKLLIGVFEAFKTLFPTGSEIGTESLDETSLPTDRSLRTMSAFLDIHILLTNYGDLSLSYYKPFIPELVESISQILLPLNNRIFLFPVTTKQRELLGNIVDIFQIVDVPFDDLLLARIIVVWSSLENHLNELEGKKDHAEGTTNSNWDHNDGDNQLDDEDLMGYLEDSTNNWLEIIVKAFADVRENSNLKQCLSHLNIENLNNLLKKLNDSKEDDEEIKNVCDKVKTITDEILVGELSPR